MSATIDEVRVVRLKPYNKRKGHLMHRYTIGGKRFVAGKWYEVSLKVAAFCEEVMARPDADPDRPGNVPAFDVCANKQAAMKLVRDQARQAAQGKKTRRHRRLHNENLLNEVDIEGEMKRQEEAVMLSATDLAQEAAAEREGRVDLDENQTAMRDMVAGESSEEAERAHESRRVHETPAPSTPKAKKPAPKTSKAKKPAQKKAAKAKKPTAAQKKKAALDAKEKAKAAKESKGMPGELDAANWDDDSPGDDSPGDDPFKD